LPSDKIKDERSSRSLELKPHHDINVVSHWQGNYMIRYDTIEEFNVDSKAECSA